MALSFYEKEAIRQSLVDPNRPTPNAAVDRILRLDAILDAVDALTAGSADAEDIVNALQTEAEDYLY
jgi:hypothetical protein